MARTDEKKRKPLVLALIGPTATGKTALSIELAREFGAEIISCDSRQIYKHMDIGTAKPTAAELAAVAHHAIDIITPDMSFSYAQFSTVAEKCADEIISRGRIPFIVGGTGFYLDGMVNGVSEIPDLDEAKAMSMRCELETTSSAALVTALSAVDPASAARIKPNDRQRLVRAIIVSRLSGRPFSAFRDAKKACDRFNYLIFGLTKPRELLYNNIGLRVDSMFENGLLGEVERLLSMGYTELSPGMKTIGYQECISHIQGKITLEEASGLIKQHTRNYAKRQETYFKKLSVAAWSALDNSRESLAKAGDSLRSTIEKYIKECHR